MCYDYSRLSGKIVESMHQYNFAIAMKLSERSLSLKLNGKVGWKDSEIWKARPTTYTGRENTLIFFLKKKFILMKLKEGHNGTNHVNQETSVLNNASIKT